jgi:anhydro-N-acetylmuramic acid kinase
VSGLYVGLISGTSVDAVDAALLAIEAGRCEIVGTHREPYPESVRKDIQTIIENPGATNIDDLGELDTEVGRVFASAALALLDETATDKARVRAIGSHGQTVRHRPDGPAPFSIQIGDPNVIASRTGTTTVADFRRRDIAMGGQGAPLVPAFHAAVFASRRKDRCVLNIGGIANITVLARSGAVSGFDTGPGNLPTVTGARAPVVLGGVYLATGSVT